MCGAIPRSAFASGAGKNKRKEIAMNTEPGESKRRAPVQLGSRPSLVTVTFAGGLIAVGSVGLTPACAPTEREVTEAAEWDDEAPTALDTLAEDGLAEAFAQFTQDFGNGDLQRIGLGHHPGLSTEKLTVDGLASAGEVVLFFPDQQLTAQLDGFPPEGDFDLWFVKNRRGSGRTVRPENGDSFFKVGSFSGRTLSANIGANITFDIDLVVVTRRNQHPTASRVVLGARTLFEKRLYRQRHGQPAEPVGNPRSNAVETDDPLVQRGAHLFFNETFAGNGRTCGTCHPAGNNTVIDKPFIDGLPASDPLFVGRPGSPLADLEDDTQLRTRALVRVHADGFDKPPVLRNVPPVSALGTGLSIQAGSSPFPISPPDQMTGWSGDGAPGRGTLHEFAFQAIMQHAPKDLARRPGTDFRIPTQEELDALEAFQLWSGRQRLPRPQELRFRDAQAEEGRSIFFDERPEIVTSRCTSCHQDTVGIAVGPVINTGTQDRTPEHPDNGFKQPGQTPLQNQAFSVPSLLDSADSPPFFHNNSVDTVELAVEHYTTAFFANSPEGQANGPIRLDQAQILAVAAFLRELNALENIRKVRARARFVRGRASSGNNALLDLALADTDDASGVLADKDLNAAARGHLAAARAALLAARSRPDGSRDPDLDRALEQLLAARDALLSTPHPDF
jgi:cytochrome c peroxidase